MKKFVLFLAIVLLIYSSTSIIFSISTEVGFIETQNELPLTRIQGVVEKNNRLYIGLADFRRIQVYDYKGTFIKSIKTYMGGKDYNFRIEDNENVHTEIEYYRNIINSSYIDKNDISYINVSQIPHVIICRTHHAPYVSIKQSYFISLFYDKSISFVISTIAILLFILSNKYVLLTIVNKLLYVLRIPMIS